MKGQDDLSIALGRIYMFLIENARRKKVEAAVRATASNEQPMPTDDTQLNHIITKSACSYKEREC